MEVINAKIFAVAKALYITAKNPPKDLKSVYIFVDSQAAIARLQNCIGNKVIQKAFKAGEEIKKHGIYVYIQWCPSHTGIQGNDMADCLAKRGLAAGNISNYAYISLSYLKKQARQKTQKEWQKLWLTHGQKENSGLGTLYRQISGSNLTFNLCPKPVIVNFPKNIISAYIQLKTGKGFLKSFQY